MPRRWGHRFTRKQSARCSRNTYKQGARERTKRQTTPCIFRIRRIPNPREKDLVLVELSARRHKLGCLFLSALISSLASATRLVDFDPRPTDGRADGRLRRPTGGRDGARLRRASARLIPNRLSYSKSVTVSRNDDLIPRPIWSHKLIRMGMGHWTWGSE